MAVSDIINQLPYTLRRRFESLSAYVRAVIKSEEETASPENRLDSNQIAVIQLFVFVRSLEFFFREGTRAATGAVDGLGELGVPGFVVGSTEFEGRNENVLRGEHLADYLRQLFEDLDAITGLEPDLTPTEVTKQLRRRMLNGTG